ncbi:MAG: hypothetical protein KME08_00760 [Aphanothece sp. CMT-3BRIN-NPC111]|jgi:hypothetical protein|nr:hypothetical protein [Aphanothece sp. CMT-3BRIN-NPC111]
METNSKETQTLVQIEAFLAENRPFGDWFYIDERTSARYDCRLEMLTEHLPITKILLTALRQSSPQSRYRVMGDPVVRSAINTALGHFKLDVPHTRLDELEAVFSIAASHLAQDKCMAPLEAGTLQAIRIGTASNHAWVWCEERADDIFGQIFRQHLASARLKLRTPNDQEQKMLVQGTQLLNDLLPKLAFSTLKHVHLVAVMEQPLGFSGITNPSILGTIFLSPSVLKNPWQVAEHLLHEALHQKLVDIVDTHSIWRRGYPIADTPTIRVIWRRPQLRNSNEWPLYRALAAFHVYVHLALFFTVVERQAAKLEKLYGPLYDIDIAVSARGAFDRAHYLGHQIKQLDRELGHAGRRFVDWLIAILNAFDPCPPPANGYVHLLLDLYDREAEELRQLIAQLNTKGKEPSAVFADTSVQQILAYMTESEIGKVQRVLSTLSEAGFPLPNLYEENHLLTTAPDNATPTEIAAKFWSVRAFVSQTLRKILPEAYSHAHQIQAKKTLGELVQEMVEHSGQCLNTLIECLSDRN